MKSFCYSFLLLINIIFILLSFVILFNSCSVQSVSITTIKSKTKESFKDQIDTNFKNNTKFQKNINTENNDIISIKSYPINTNSNNKKVDIASSIPVLTYHHILNDEDNSYGKNAFIVSTKNFMEQMHLLKNNGYDTITLQHLDAYIKGELTIPRKSVLITFDDGYKSNYICAYPILKELSFKGTIFIVTNWIKDTIEEFNPLLFQMMSWPEIEDSKDVFEYASHTHNLHFEDENNICAFLSSSKETIENDLTKSRLLLNNTPYIAYPYGKIDENTINIVKNLGFTMGFTVSEGNIKPGDNIYMLKRQAIFQSTTLDQFKKIVGID